MNIKITQSSDEQIEFLASNRSHYSKAMVPTRSRVSYLTVNDHIMVEDELSHFKLELIKCEEGSSIDVNDHKK